MNIVYLLFMLGFESVWVVVVPVQVTELMFPARGRDPWLRLPGLIVACVFFLLGCQIAWFGWTLRALPMMHVAQYHPPVAALVCGVAAIGLLVWLAYLLQGVGLPRAGDARGTAPVCLAGLTAFVMGALWFGVITQIFVPKPIQPCRLVLVMGSAWALLAYELFSAWSSRAAWAR